MVKDDFIEEIGISHENIESYFNKIDLNNIFFIHLIDIGYSKAPKTKVDKESKELIYSGELEVEYTYILYAKDLKKYKYSIKVKFVFDEEYHSPFKRKDELLNNLTAYAKNNKFYIFGKKKLVDSIPNDVSNTVYSGLYYNPKNVDKKVKNILNNKNKNSKLESTNYIEQLIKLEVKGLATNGKLNKDKTDHIQNVGNRLKESNLDLVKAGFSKVSSHKYSNIFDVYFIKFSNFEFYFTLNTGILINPSSGKIKICYQKNSSNPLIKSTVKSIVATITYYSKYKNKAQFAETLESVLDGKRKLVIIDKEKVK